MSEKTTARRLSETVVPGKDYADKKHIRDVLDREVLVTNIEKVAGSPEFALVDPETGEIISRDYWNVEVAVDGLFYTFSTGAVPVDKVLTALRDKLDSGEAKLPLLATFRKAGRTYIVE